MRRRNWFEITDYKWCPSLLRDTATDILRFTSVRTNTYGPVEHRLKSLLEKLDCHDIVDLCSGGTGPVLLIQKHLIERECYPVRVVLTDKFPNLKAFQEWSRRRRIPCCRRGRVLLYERRVLDALVGATNDDNRQGRR